LSVRYHAQDVGESALNEALVILGGKSSRRFQRGIS
jgi:hypothetical protein